MIAALNQVGVTTTVTTPVLIAVLATGGGVIGGALARPLQDRWASWPHRMSPEPPVIAEQGRARETPGRVAAPQAEIEQPAQRLSIPKQ